MKTTTKNGEELTNDELTKMLAAAVPDTLNCPDCGRTLMPGPCGGLSQNFSCSAVECGSRFNYMGPFGVQRISDARPDVVADLRRQSAYRQ
jgi:hypothetical protein